MKNDISIKRDTNMDIIRCFALLAVVAVHFFLNSGFKKILPALENYPDDLVIITAARNNVSIINTGYNSHPLYIDGTQEECLYQINKTQNDVQLKKVVEHYKDELRDTIYANL